MQRALIAIPVLLLLHGCASVPPEAVDLSATVGRRLADVQSANENLLAGYFDLSRARVEDFLEQRWIPAYLETYVRDAKLAERIENPEPLDEADLARLEEALTRTGKLEGDAHKRALLAVNRALGDSHRGEVVLLFAQAGLENIEAERRQLLDPIDAQEKKALGALRESYAELIEMQSTVTAFIGSVRKEREAEDAILKRLGVLDERDRIVDESIKLNDQIMNATSEGEDALNVAEKIKALLDGK